MKRIFVCLLVAAFLAGCARKLPQLEETKPQQSQNQPAQTQPVVTEAPQVDVLKLFSDGDYKTQYDKFAAVTLAGNTASCDSNAVRIDGSSVTITDEGTYVLSGSLEGMVLVDAGKDDQVQLVLQNAQITNPAGAALYIRQADKVVLTLAEQSENTLTAGETFSQIDDNNVDGALFSKADLTVNGTGKLRVFSPGGHGIVCKDSLRLTGGSCYVESAEHGITANDEICIDARGLELYAGKDGLHCENKEDAALGYIYVRNGRLLITCEGDGISAGAWFYAHGGEYEIFAGGGSQNGSKQTSDHWGAFPDGWGGARPGKGQRPQGGQMPQMPQGGQPQQTVEEDSASMKAIKAGTWLTVNGGVLNLDSADDGLHSDGGMDITSGWVNLRSGDDGIHAEQTLTVAGGEILVKESYEGMEALHVKIYDGNITLTASDDGINAAGGTDESGFGGRDQWGGGKGGFGGPGGFGGGNGSILIAGGKVEVTASGDALDANGTLEIAGGSVTLCGPTRGDTAVLDYDRSGTITGGTFLGTGSTMMAQTLTGTEQGVISLKVSNQIAGTPLTVTDSKGNTLIAHTPQLDYTMVIFSSPEIVKGETYTVTMGSITQQVTAK